MGHTGSLREMGVPSSHLVFLGFVARDPVVCLVREVALEPLALL